MGKPDNNQQILRARVRSQSVFKTALRIVAYPELRGPTLRCIRLIFYHFFFQQYKAALFPKRIPVSQVDHPLDMRIPFSPSWVGIYMDFSYFWIRILGFMLSQYGEQALGPVKEFIESMGAVYAYAGEVYAANLSTTHRPRYLAKAQFVLIHVADPHLMCVPSLHVMVMINAYTRFTAMVNQLGGGERFAEQIREIRQGAIEITEAILYVKQHSVNCIAAAMYAMTRFAEPLFPLAEAENFASLLYQLPASQSLPPRRGRRLFNKAVSLQAEIPEISTEDREPIRQYIYERYRQFMLEGSAALDWKKPLLDFLAETRRL